MLHTGGFGYDFFNEDLIKYGEKREVPSVVTSSMASLTSCLLFDPGEQWEYGSNIDWVGKVVEGARGKRLGEVMKERIFEPLGMNDTAFTMTDDMRSRRATMHQRAEVGTLTPMSDFELPSDPEQHMGGHGLYSTVGDYMKFIRMILNGGEGEHGRVLTPEIVEIMGQNGLGEMKIKPLPGVIKELSNDAEFFPGMPKSWGYTFMINDHDAPTGRPAGELGWPRQHLLLDRPQERPRRFLGDPDIPVRRPGLVHRLYGLRDGGLRGRTLGSLKAVSRKGRPFLDTALVSTSARRWLRQATCRQVHASEASPGAARLCGKRCGLLSALEQYERKPLPSKAELLTW